MNQNKSALSGRTRSILIAAACVLACAVIVLAIVLIVPHGSSAERKEYESIAAYNEAHGTDYIVPAIPSQTAELYTDRQTYVYRAGWSDLLLQMQFNYSGNSCNYYIQPDKEEDLAARDGFTFLAEYDDLDKSWTVSLPESSGDTTFRYRKVGGRFLTKVETEDAIYYLSVDSEGQEGIFTTVTTAVFHDLIAQ